MVKTVIITSCVVFFSFGLLYLLVSPQKMDEASTFPLNDKTALDTMQKIKNILIYLDI